MQAVSDSLGCELILYATLLALVIGKDLTASEQNLFGNFLTAIGQNLTILAAVDAYTTPLNNPPDCSNSNLL